MFLPIIPNHHGSNQLTNVPIYLIFLFHCPSLPLVLYILIPFCGFKLRFFYYSPSISLFILVDFLSSLLNTLIVNESHAKSYLLSSLIFLIHLHRI